MTLPRHAILRLHHDLGDTLIAMRDHGATWARLTSTGVPARFDTTIYLPADGGSDVVSG